MNAKRKYKDTVYRMIFKEPDKALSLYNSLNGTDYTDETMLEFNTLENAIYMGMKNDLSFLILDQMYLCEQQSTHTPNMPLRNLFYVADLLQASVKDKVLYSSRQIKLPAPHFVVFYNGTEPLPEQMELKLSDAYEVPTDEPELELKVRILNINRGMNEELKRKCPALKEYMIYVEKVRSYTKIMSLEEAVERAIEECIRDNVLRDFLLRQKAEVVKMSIYEYDEEKVWEAIRADERELARELAREEVDVMMKEARQKLEAEHQKLEAEHQKLEAARQKTEAAEQNTIKTVISMCKEFGCTRKEASEKLADKCHLSRQDAEEQISIYW